MYRNNVIDNTSKQLLLSYNNVLAGTNFSIFHCFGEFDAYVGIDGIPNATHYVIAVPFDGGSLSSYYLCSYFAI